MKEIFSNSVDHDQREAHREIFDKLYKKLIVGYRHVDDLIGGDQLAIMMGVIDDCLEDLSLSKNQKKDIKETADRILSKLQEDLIHLKKEKSYLYEYEDSISLYVRELCADVISYVWPVNSKPIIKDDLNPSV